MSSNQPSLAPTVIRVALVTTSGTTPPPNGPELTWMVLDSTFDTQPTVSPSGVCARAAVNSYSAVSGGQSISTTAARRARLPAAAPIVRKRLPPDTTRLVVKKSLDRVEDRILVRGGLGGGPGSRGGPAEVIPHAGLLLPALERVGAGDRLPPRVAVLEQPA